METNAKYVQIGVFLLAAVGAIFGFVYWLYDSGGIGTRSEYRVRFEGTVSGLLVGSAVLFNGVRVGDVTELTLDQEQPEQVFATLSVDHATPVRPDTRVDIDFQGFTGSPAIALTGGSADLKRPEASNGQPALLHAVPEAGDDVTRSAQRVLRKIDRVLSDNADPLKEGIADLGTFAKALSRNSGRVDGILAGLERMTGGAAKTDKLKTFDLTAPETFTEVAEIPTVQLVIPEPTASNVLNSNRISVRTSMNEITNLENAQWADALPLLLQTKIMRSFENAGMLNVMTQQTADFDADYQLVTDIRRFGLVQATTRTTEVVLSAKLMNRDGRVTAARLFQASQLKTGTEQSITELDVSFQTVVTDLVPWVATAIARNKE